jgi:hypothetical protein
MDVPSDLYVQLQYYDNVEHFLIFAEYNDCNKSSLISTVCKNQTYDNTFIVLCIQGQSLKWNFRSARNCRSIKAIILNLGQQTLSKQIDNIQMKI